MSLVAKIVGAAVGDAARAMAESEAEKRAENAAWWWLSRGLFMLFLVVGWLFILWQNKFHLDAPVVVICLGYLAVVLTVTNLWRVGAAAVAPEHAGEEAWSRPLGERGELEKEKKTLLKAIKEAEFDQAMGKLSKSDAEDLIRMYRARAIELIKELDRLDAGQAGTPRERIEREVAARVAIEVEKEKIKARQKADAKNAKGGKKDAKDKDAKDAKPDDAKGAKTDDAKSAAKAEDAKADDAKGAKTDDAKGAKTDDAKGAKTDDVASEAAKANSKTAKADDAKSEAKADDAKVDDAKADAVKAEAKAAAAKVDDAKVDDAKVDDAKVDDAKVDDAKVDDAKVDDAKLTESAGSKSQEASS